jgi:outer membrane protein assembly factor BamB
MMKSLTKALCVLSLGVTMLLPSQRAVAEDWFRWRGPDLNGISRETGWLAKWPDEGPNRLWKASVGTGFSSVSVSSGHLYTMGNDGQKTDTVYCFDAASGAPVWKHSYRCLLDPKFFEGGPTATPTVDGNRVYTMSRKGDLFCLNATDGKVIWSKNVHGDFGYDIPMWGFAGSPLVQGDLLTLNVGTAGTGLDKKTGKVIWHSDTGAPGYATAFPFKASSGPAVAIFGSEALNVVKPDDGELLWSYPWKTLYNVNAADPVTSDGKMLVSSGYDHGSALLDISGDKPKVLWENKEFRNQLNASVLWHGFLYGVDDIAKDTYALKCVNWNTGEIMWAEPKFGNGSLIIADGKIIGLSEKGEIMVAEASPMEFKPISRAQVLGGKCWTTPVLSNGRIYCRNAKGDLVCLDVSGKSAIARP